MNVASNRVMAIGPLMPNSACDVPASVSITRMPFGPKRLVRCDDQKQPGGTEIAEASNAWKASAEK